MATGPGKEQVVGIDIGGTGIKGALVDVKAGKLAAPRVRLSTPHPATPSAVAATVGEVLEQIGADGPVGLTLPAVVRGGTVETAANIDHAWIGLDAVDLFSRATGRLVAVVNDADAAGLAEVRFGAGRSISGVIAVITLGTGIGSAVLVDGTLVPNTEFGHLPLHHGDAGKLGGRIGPRARRAVLEAVRPSASGLSGPRTAPDLAAIDHHRWWGQRQRAKVLAENRAPDAHRPGPTPERCRDHRSRYVRIKRRVRYEDLSLTA